MKKTLITVSVALASLLAANAFAQTSGPGQDKAMPSAPATAAEKAAAKKARTDEGKKVSKASEGVTDQPSSTASGKVAKSEKAAAKAKRKAAGADATKAPKDKTGPNS